jgi:hypothetical protein
VADHKHAGPLSDDALGRRITWTTHHIRMHSKEGSLWLLSLPCACPTRAWPGSGVREGRLSRETPWGALLPRDTLHEVVEDFSLHAFDLQAIA